MEDYKESGGSLEGLRREDISYLVDRILEKDKDQRIKIEPLYHSYALEWEPLGKQESEKSETCNQNPEFNGLRRSLLHSSPRKDDPKYKDIIERRLAAD